MKYAMLLRGMGPGDPKFNNRTICVCLESLGYGNVGSLLASGNYVFESDESDIAALERQIEQSIETRIGYQRSVVVRSADQIAEIIKSDPFNGAEHSEGSYLLVTFMKRPQQPSFSLPHQPEGKPYSIIGYNKGVIYSVTDNRAVKTPDLMLWLERQFGKDITSRTWNTMVRIHKRLS
jgi:uncharacterized protein (DUF1697 family)